MTLALSGLVRGALGPWPPSGPGYGKRGAAAPAPSSRNIIRLYMKGKEEGKGEEGERGDGRIEK